MTATPLDLRVRTWLRIASWLQRAGYYPTMARMGDVPLAKRKAQRPPRWLSRPVPRDVDVRDLGAGELGAPVAVRLYHPAGVSTPLPIVAFAHGGGFVNCGLESMHYTCAMVARGARVLVASVDYPLAPEAPFPAALEAFHAAVGWLAETGGELGGDPVDLTVMGDSAGGNLAAAACLLARRSGPPISRQILIYPTLDGTLSTPRLLAESPERRAECEAFFAHYAGGHDRRDELVSPLLAEDLSDLPDATIVTAEHDSFSDDGTLYAQRLEAAGVPVHSVRYAGMPHGFLSMPRLCKAAPLALAEIDAALMRKRREIPLAAHRADTA